MSHFDLAIAICADFARGILAAENRPAVERHIAICPKCAATAGWLREVTAFAAADQQYEPPPHALKQARAQFMREFPGIVSRACDSPSSPCWPLPSPQTAPRSLALIRASSIG
jgi:anti-sigma factor RsiW